MRVRAIDDDGDWMFGTGKASYRSNNQAIAQNINTRLNSFLGNCFFSLGDGIDWFNLLGNFDRTALNLAITSTILNTTGVTALVQFSSNLDSRTRDLSVSYVVQTTFSVISGNFIFNSSVIGT